MPEASNLSTIEVVFNDQGNKVAQNSPQFKNKNADFEHPVKLDLSVNNIGQIAKYVTLGQQINYITSYGGTDAERAKDYEAIKLLCKIVLSVNKDKPGFEKVYNKAAIINANIPTIYNELIPNAQKAICENLMKDETIHRKAKELIYKEKILRMLKKKGVHEDYIGLLNSNTLQMKSIILKYRSQVEVNDSDWYSDEDARAVIIEEARKRNLKIAFYFKFSNYRFEIGAMNKAYVDPMILKSLNQKLMLPVRDGQDLINAFEASTSSIGAGLGLDLTKICIKDIEDNCNVKAYAKYENDHHGMLIMSIRLNLDRTPDQ